MAKKVVATLKSAATSTKNVTKVIKMVKSDKTGSYTFKTEIIQNDAVKAFFEGK